MKSLRATISKLSAYQRTLAVAYINACLATQDGKIPNKLRVDHDTFELYALCPPPEGSEGVAEVLRPILSALKAAKRRAK